MSSYDINMYSFADLEDRVKLPSYQRPVVWTKGERQNFIANLAKGFPFGSLLLYEYPEDLGKYTLIDGQQRYTTMREYVANPADYFPVGQFSFDEKILDIVGKSGVSSESQKDELRARFLKIVEELLVIYAEDDSNLKGYFLRDRVIDECPLLKENCSDARDRLIDLQAEIVREFDNYLNMDDIKIPCIVFRGSESDLPEVFASVNLGGRKLTKYQVFAAQWNRYTVPLSKGEISKSVLENVVERYEKLTDDRGGLEIEDFDAGEMRSERKVTLPEFCHSLGQEILKVTPACWPKKTSSQDDTVDTIGYNTIAIVFGIKPQNINKLAEEYSKTGLEDNPEATANLITRILDEYRAINGTFSLYLHRPGKDSGSSSADDFQNDRAIGQLQFLSLFAALWRIKYGAPRQESYGADLNPQPHYRKDYERTLKNLFRCYLVDMLSNQWKGSGDSRLGQYINGDKNYLAGTSPAALNTALNSWADEEAQTPSININSTTRILLTIFASAKPEKFGCSSYDFEHIVARKVLKKSSPKSSPLYKEHSLPGGMPGNIMFLESSQNRGKHEKNLAAYAGEELDINQERQYLPNKDTLDEIEYQLKGANNPEPFKKMVENRQKEIFAEIEKQVFPNLGSENN